MEELMYQVRRGTIDGIDWDKHIENFLGILDFLPFAVQKAFAVARSSKAVTVFSKSLHGGTSFSFKKAGEVLEGKEAHKLLRHNGPEPKPTVDNPQQFKGSTAVSTLDVVNAADPLAAGKLFSAVNRQLVQAFGLRAEDVLSRFMPKPKGFDSTGMSEAALAGIAGRLAEFEEFYHTINPSFYITGTERNVAIETLQARLANKTGIQYFGDKTKIDFYNKGFTIEAMYGKDLNGGYKTLGEAKASAANLGENIEDLEIIAVNPITQEFGVISAQALKLNEEVIGDFYIRAKIPYLYGKDTAGKFTSKLDFHTGNFEKRVYTPMPIANFLTPAQFVFERSIVLGASRAIDLKPGLAKRLNKLVSGFLKASKSSKIKAQMALEEGSEAGEIYSKKQFMTKFDASQADFDAYGSARMFFDTIFDIRNEALRKKMVSEGYRWISNPSGFTGLGKPVNKLPVEVQRVWDTGTGTFRRVIGNFIDRLNKEKKSLVQLWKPHVNKGGSYDYAIVVPSGKVTELPRVVLTHTPGYVTRIYEDPFFIKADIPTMHNGLSSTFTKTLGTAEGELAAKRAVEAYNADPRNTGVKAHYIRDSKKDINPEAEARNSSLWYEKRGPRLQRGIEGSGGMAPIVNPIRAIETTAASVSKVSSIGEWISPMKQRYINTYGDRLSKPGQFSPPGTGFGLGTDEGRQAAALYDYIKLMSDTRVAGNEMYEGFINGILAVLNKLGLEKTAIASDKALYNLTPSDAARGITFSVFVALHPLKQLVQNTALILWTGAVDPLKAAQAISDTTMLLAALATRGMPGPLQEAHKLALKGYAASLGVTPKEAAEIMEQFRLSGLADTIDAHNIYNSSVLDHNNQVEHFGVTIAKAFPRVLKGTARGVKKVGFDASEILNLMLHFQMARRAYLIRKSLPANAKMDQSAIDEISADAKILAGNQNKSGVAKMQQVLPNGVQFLQFITAHTLSLFRSHVATEAIGAGRKVFKKIDNRILYGLAAWGMFGAETFRPFIEMYEESTGTTIPEEYKDIILFSLVDEVVNGLMSAATGEESDLAVSQVISPAVAFSAAVDYVSDVYNGDMDLLAFLWGPSKMTGSRIKDAVEFAIISQLDDGTTATDSLIANVESAVQIIRGWDDASQAYYAYQTGYFTSKRNNKQVLATLPRVLGKLVGIRSKEELALFDLGRDKKSLLDSEAAYVNSVANYIISITKEGLTPQVAAKIVAITKKAHPDWDPTLLNALSLRVARRIDKYAKGLTAAEQVQMFGTRDGNVSKTLLERMANDSRLSDDTRKWAQDYLNTKGQ
jgi:hypothetical protein